MGELFEGGADEEAGTVGLVTEPVEHIDDAFDCLGFSRLFGIEADAVRAVDLGEIEPVLVKHGPIDAGAVAAVGEIANGAAVDCVFESLHGEKDSRFGRLRQ